MPHFRITNPWTYLLDACMTAQAKEAAVEKKLKTEVKVLDHRIAEMEVNLSEGTLNNQL